VTRSGKQLGGRRERADAGVVNFWMDAPDDVLGHGDGWVEPKIPHGPTRPNPARIYDYWLGGRDHYACDREVGDRVARQAPWAPWGARACRAFLRDGVAWLAGHGLEQFLDIGSGLPSAGNVHQIARLVNPGARVVYVDHDPVVLAHAHALLKGDDGVEVLEGDLRDPAALLAAVRDRADVIDLDQPIAVLLSAVLHFIGDDEEPHQILATLRAGLAPGSHVLISHTIADDDATGRATRAAAAGYSWAAQPFHPRTTAEVMALFEGFEPVPPGVHRLPLGGRTSTVLGGIAALGSGGRSRPAVVSGGEW
jgi:S-adenosyl methyltransferase